MASRGHRAKRDRIGIALAGGGFLGVAYELGALAALDESVRGLDLARLDVCVGVSAGAFLAAGLANGISPLGMTREFIHGSDEATSFDPADLLRPDWRQFRDSLRRTPGVVRAALGEGLADLGVGLTTSLWRMTERAMALLPTGIVDARPAGRRLAQMLSSRGGSNDFRKLRTVLRVVATDIDTGEAVAFGGPGFDDVPISRAVLASSAVPGLFAPVRIGGRHFVDGALNKTMHASVALENGARLVFCLNPLVPYAADGDGARRVSRSGLPAVLTQTVRTTIRSRMAVGLEKYRHTHPEADVVLFEPSRSDASVFFANMFSLSNRRRLCEHAYQTTRAELLRRADELAPVFARHGLFLDHDLLREAGRRLVDPVQRAPRRRGRLGRSAVSLGYALDDLERCVELRPRATGRVAGAN